jgi:hypothetical protein
MTLVAAYRERDVPVLIGDLLITGGEPGEARKKIHRLRPTLAVGYAGSLVAATRILSDLNARLSGFPSRSEFEAALRTTTVLPAGAQNELQLTGWLIDGAAHCFFWDSERPMVIEYHDESLIGTGQKRFADFIVREWPENASLEVEKLVLEKMCALMSDESLGLLKNRSHHFGLAYEALLFGGERFEYIDDVAYVATEFAFSSAGKYLGGPRPRKVHRCWHYYGCAVVQTLELSSGSDAAELQQKYNLVMPVFDAENAIFHDFKRRLDARDYLLPSEPAFSCLFAIIVEDADTEHRRYASAPWLFVDVAREGSHILSIRFLPQGGSAARGLHVSVVLPMLALESMYAASRRESSPPLNSSLGQPPLYERQA